MSTTPIFTATPRCANAAISTANTNRDGTGTIGTVFTAGANGSRIDFIRIVASATTTAGVVRLWIYNGSAYFLWKERLVSAITPSATVAVFNDSVLDDLPLIIPSGYSLRASTHNAENFNIHAMGGDF